MALFFPLNISTTYNPLGYPTGFPNQHCKVDRDRDAGHVFVNRDIRCFGPTKLGEFVEVVMVKGPFVDNPKQNIPAWNDYPSRNIYTTLNRFVPTVIKFSQPTDGSDGNTNFLKQFEVSWLKMVTAGYHEIDGKKGKLGTLKTFKDLNC
jgi:hypothetical protein